MKFMGRTLTTGKGDDCLRSDWRFYPMICFGQDIHGRWFGLITCQLRGAGFGVSGKPSLRAAKAALEKQVRMLRAELETLA